MNVRLLCGVPIAIADDGTTRDFLRALCVTAEPPAFTLEVAERATLPNPSGELLFRGPDFEARANASALELAVRDGDHPVAWCQLRRDGEAVLVLRTALSAPERSLRDELLPELIVAHRWPLLGHCYLHAAAGLSQQGARLFVGPSGRGKSTAAALLAAAGEPVFCADRCAVGGRPAWAAAAPWHGGAPSAGDRVPLHAIFALSRVGPPRRRQLSPAEALAALSVGAFLPRWWPEGLEAGLDALVQLARSAPVFELCSEPDERLVQRVQEAA